MQQHGLHNCCFFVYQQTTLTNSHEMRFRLRLTACEWKRSYLVLYPISGEGATTMSDGSESPSQISSLQYGSFQNSLATLTPEAEDKPAISPRSTYVAVAVLCYVNLVNYIERYTIAGTWWGFFFCLFLPFFGEGVLATWMFHVFFILMCHNSQTGVLPNIQAYFVISDGTAALLQTGT